MTLDTQSISSAKSYLEDALLTIEKTKMGVFGKTESLYSANASGTSHAGQVSRVNSDDPVMDITVEALCDLSQIFMQAKGTYASANTQITNLINEINGWLSTVTDPNMKTLLQNALNCFVVQGQPGYTVNDDTKKAFTTFWLQSDPKDPTVNPAYNIMMFFKTAGFSPENAPIDVGYKLAMFDLSFFDSGLEAVGIQPIIDKMIGKGNFFSCEDDLWRFILTYAKEKGIPTDLIQSILPAAPTPAGTAPNYEKFLKDLQTGITNNYPGPTDPDADALWSAWHLSTFLDPSQW